MDWKPVDHGYDLWVNTMSDHEREIPTNLGAEMSVLGAILCNNDTYFHVAEFLKPEDFFDASHQKLYGLFQKHIDAGQLVNPVTLCNKLEGVDVFELGGTAYLAKLAGYPPTLINTKEYGKIVVDMSCRRKIMELCWSAINEAVNTSTGDAASIVESLEQSLHTINHTSEASNGLAHVSSSVESAIEQVQASMLLKDGEIAGVTTGLKSLDRLTGGLFPGELIILAGRPAMGKTALAMNILKGAAKDGHYGAFFSLEMQRHELGQRLISDMAHNETSPLAYFDARVGNFDQHQFERFKAVGEKAARLPIYITDKSNASTTSIRLECLKLRRLLETKGKTLDLVVVDYLGLMNAGDRYRGNRVGEITEITRTLKNLAKEFNIPFLVLSQLSRNLEHRDDKKPIMSDLRDSGSIEQDANMILFVYREHEYLKKKEPKESTKFDEWFERCQEIEDDLEIIIAKQRAGPTGTANVKFYKKTSAVRG